MRWGCSNGNAAGNTLEEAILQGFFELVERDAMALWWYNRLRKPGVAVETFGEPYLLELAEETAGLFCLPLPLTLLAPLFRHGVPTRIPENELSSTANTAMAHMADSYFSILHRPHNALSFT
jgi:hypothetical protein